MSSQQELEHESNAWKNEQYQVLQFLIPLVYKH